MRFKILYLILFAAATLLLGCSSNKDNTEEDIHNKQRNDTFKKPEVITYNYDGYDDSKQIEDITNTYDEIKTEGELIEEINNSKTETIDINRPETFDCNNFTQIETQSNIDTMIDIEITNYNVLDLLEKIERESECSIVFKYAIQEICKEYSIEVNDIKAVKEDIIYSNDYEYMCISLQSSKYYINIGYKITSSFDTNILCYEIKNKD